VPLVKSQIILNLFYLLVIGWLMTLMRPSANVDYGPYEEFYRDRNLAQILKNDALIAYFPKGLRLKELRDVAMSKAAIVDSATKAAVDKLEMTKVNICSISGYFPDAGGGGQGSRTDRRLTQNIFIKEHRDDSLEKIMNCVLDLPSGGEQEDYHASPVRNDMERHEH
jgi:hypothetical protein